VHSTQIGSFFQPFIPICSLCKEATGEARADAVQCYLPAAFPQRQLKIAPAE